MITLNITEDMLNKHKKYILDSGIINRLERLLQDDFCREIQNYWEEKEYVEQHKCFIKQALDQVSELSKNLSELKNNWFLEKPKQLRDSINEFNNEYPKVKTMLSKGTPSFTVDDLTLNYKDAILWAFGYEQFSATEQMNVYDQQVKLLSGYTQKKIKEAIKGKTTAVSAVKEVITLLEADIVAYAPTPCREIKTLLAELSCKNLDHIKTYTDIWKTIYDAISMCRKKCQQLSKEQSVTIMNQQEMSAGNWSAYQMVMSLGIKVCPYCNENYILPFHGTDKKYRPDLDHFFAKSLYPFLSMSIYNLIPACKECNSALKGMKEFDESFLNLYEAGIDDLYRFTYIPHDYDSFTGVGDSDIDIMYSIPGIESHHYVETYDTLHTEGMKKSDEERMSINHDFFKISERYRYHTDVVKEYLKKRMIFSDEYIENIYRQYQQLFDDKQDVYRFVFEVDSEYQNQPLGKLKHDILEELLPREKNNKKPDIYN